MIATPNRRRFLLALSSLPLLAGALAPGTGAAAEAETPAFAAGEMALGEASAGVTMIEYFSFTCGHCANFHRNTLGPLREAYIEPGLVRLVVREFPSSELALRASMLARCAGLERYFAFQAMLFEKFEYWVNEQNDIRPLAQLAALGGIGPERFAACTSDPAIEAVVLENYLSGVNEHGVEYTPTFIINGRKIVGDKSLDEFRRILDSLIDS